MPSIRSDRLAALRFNNCEFVLQRILQRETR